MLLAVNNMFDCVLQCAKNATMCALHLLLLCVSKNEFIVFQLVIETLVLLQQLIIRFLLILCLFLDSIHIIRTLLELLRQFFDLLFEFFVLLDSVIFFIEIWDEFTNRIDVPELEPLDLSDSDNNLMYSVLMLLACFFKTSESLWNLKFSLVSVQSLSNTL